MNADEMRAALEAVGCRLAEQQLRADIVIAGGAWMALVLGSRDITKDIDAYLAPPSEPVRRAADQVASEFGLPDDWLNDGIKEFFYKTPPQSLWHTFGNLCVYAVSADYMLALKIYAARVSDRADVQALIHHLDLHSAEEIQEIVERYIPTNLLGAKHRFFAESCIEEEGMSSP